MTDENFPPSPFGLAIRDARKRAGLSVRQAAQKADLSEGRWRQIELGYQQVAKEVRVPASPRAATVETMAKAVGLDVFDALNLAGFPDEAETERRFRRVMDNVSDDVAPPVQGASYVADQGDEPLPPGTRTITEQDLLEEFRRVRVALEQINEKLDRRDSP